MDQVWVCSPSQLPLSSARRYSAQFSLITTWLMHDHLQNVNIVDNRFCCWRPGFSVQMKSHRGFQPPEAWIDYCVDCQASVQFFTQTCVGPSNDRQWELGCELKVGWANGKLTCTITTFRGKKYFRHYLDRLKQFIEGRPQAKNLTTRLPRESN